VEAAVIEAGLGGRLDATNVLDSRATSLTSVGLDHVQWLGHTELEIATEKLDVLRPGSLLVLGDLSPDVEALARRTAAEREAEVLRPEPLPAELIPPGFAPYLRRNAAVAVALARVVAPDLTDEAITTGLASALLPGRAEALGGEPPLFADAAHNEQGARALAEALPGLAAGRPVFACLSMLDDKDREGILAALAPALAAAVCTAAEPGPAMGRPGATAADPAELAALLRADGVEAEVVADPAEAVARTLLLARERDGVALCAGSHYLLRYAWTARHAQNSSR
jgi:dihydrofolate synthase/folylpolyglutamate synthase